MSARRFLFGVAALVALAGCDVTGAVAPTVTNTPVRDTITLQRFPTTGEGGRGTALYCGNGDIGRVSGVRRLVVVVHGLSRNACDYAASAVESAHRRKVLDETLVVAPLFSEQDWPDDDWKSGGVSASAPHLSSFAVVDQMIAAARRTMPELEDVVVAGHSAGGQFTNRYAAGTRQAGITRFVVANPSSYLYLDGRRWAGSTFRELTDVERAECDEYDEYKYGLNGLNEYMAAVGAPLLRSQYGSRPITYLLGAEDTSTTSSNLDRSCAAQWQGRHRLERGERYHQALGGVFGPQVYERHVLLVVPSVGHEAGELLRTPQGQAALFDHT
jgi:pimeloyl-ACP methyl ester carboxylesterase